MLSEQNERPQEEERKNEKERERGGDIINTTCGKSLNLRGLYKNGVKHNTYSIRNKDLSIRIEKKVLV